MKTSQNKIYDQLMWILCAIMFLTGVYFRFYNLRLDSLWLDEIMTWDVSQQTWDFILKFRQNDFNPPLYDYLQKLVLFCFPVHDEFSIRFLSAVLGVCAMAAVFLVCRKRFGFSAAVIALSIVSVSNSQIYFSREARPYTLMLLGAVLSINFALEIIEENPRIKTIFFYAISLLTLCYSHYGGLILGFWICFGVQLFSWLYRKNLKQIFCANLLVLIGYLPWLATAFKHTGEIPDWIGMHSEPFLNEIQKIFFFTFRSYISIPREINFYFSLYCILASVFAAIFWFKKDFKALKNFVLINLCFFVPFVFVYTWVTWISPRGLIPRHLMSLSAPLILAASLVLGKLSFKKPTALLLAVLIFGLQLKNLQYFLYRQHKHDLRSTSEWIAAQADAKTTPILGISFRSEAADFYLKKYGLKNLHLTEAFDQLAEARVWNEVKNEKKILVIEALPENAEPFLKGREADFDYHIVKKFPYINIYEMDKKVRK